jgi:methylenetetrahydrofolate dehydrogenase (NADP+)/methenyltetrahydrofolate cyclohydrolase
MGEIISGKVLSKEIREQVRIDVEKLKDLYGAVPHLVVVLIGEDPASQSYVKSKERACIKAGMKSTVIRKEDTVSEAEVLSIIDALNKDDDVHGILVQLPVPKHIDENKIIDAIDYRKDVDGFHPLNIAYMHMGRPAILPATPKGIITMLKSINVDLVGKDAIIIGRSNIVGKPAAMLLMKEHCTVQIAHSRTKNLKEKCLNADIIVAAVGRANTVTADMVKDGAIIIDVGVNRVDGKLVGDVDFEHVKDKASYITPVPGGVGPMTITSLLQNTIETFKECMNID